MEEISSETLRITLWHALNLGNLLVLGKTTYSTVYDIKRGFGEDPFQRLPRPPLQLSSLPGNESQAYKTSSLPKARCHLLVSPVC